MTFCYIQITPKFRRDGLPSYSWTCWRSMAHWDVALNSAIIVPDVASNDSQLTNTAASESVLTTWIDWYLLCKNSVFQVNSNGTRWPAAVSINEISPACHSEFQRCGISEEQDDHKACTPAPYTVLLFWPVCIHLPMAKPTNATFWTEHLQFNVLGHYGEVCGQVDLDTDYSDRIREGMFALIAGNGNGRFWALLLNRQRSGHMGRWGLANLTSKCLDGHSQHAPRWKKIILA